ncbi:hypothetical protein KKG31_05395 [Patescibacteria group bacterium]|nr:hypothetical protein [Patescibacteria group bacterium]MBU1758544.1 hypothetical protein [Patescibacteria group bacterium]
MIPAYHEYWVKTIKEAKINAPSGILSKDDTRRLFKEANIFCIKEEIRKAKEIAQ